MLYATTVTCQSHKLIICDMEFLVNSNNQLIFLFLRFLNSSKMAEVGKQGEMGPNEKWAEIVLNFDQNPWWWAINICLSAIAVVANLIFIVTVVHNR